MLKRIVEVPVCLRCWTCEFEGRPNTRQKTEMYINSTRAVARYANLVIWKCPKCGKTQVEKFKKLGEGSRFYDYAHNKGWVLHEDHMYKGRVCSR